VLGTILTVLYVLACVILILFVLLQPGKSDAAAVFGGGANSTAFGPRGTQTVLAKITITAAIVFFLIAFLFSIPGLFAKRSLGEGVGPAEPAQQAPITPAPAPESAPQPDSSGAAPQGNAPANQGKPAEAPKTDDKKPASDKKPDKQ